MKGWIEAKEVTAGKWWVFTRDNPPIYPEFAMLKRTVTDPSNDCYLGRDRLFWKRGKPEADDDRWLPAEEAVKEWGEKGGSKGWWIMPTYANPVDPRPTAYALGSPRLASDGEFSFIPRGKPPVPKPVECAVEPKTITLEAHREALREVARMVVSMINKTYYDQSHGGTDEKIR